MRAAVSALFVLLLAGLAPAAGCLSSADDGRSDIAQVGDDTAQIGDDTGADVSECKPQCDDKVCGDNGCGGTCGACPGAGTCVDGSCVCIPSCSGKTCGDNGCGGTCGTCGPGDACSDGACACAPNCAGKACGDNGCGGTCGTCQGCLGPQPELCNSDGTCTAACCLDCNGKECGDDGCSGSCGTCAIGDTCTDGTCGCVPDCSGKACGDNGCGGSCGACDPGAGCKEGQCVANCVADCSGKVCGDNGCGGSCGSCGDDQHCDAGQCACTPQCVGKACGDNGCGGSCGQCGGGLTCTAGGTCACTPQCAGKACGPNGCGGSCGACGPNQACDDGGQCQCAPQCAGKTCGPDGCNGSCGTCDSGSTCTNGQCVCTPDCGSDPVRECGDNGCGGSCGACEGTDVCSGGRCIGAPGATYTMSIGDWTMQPAAETTKCVVKRLSNTSDIVVTSIHTKLAAGSHHMIVYRSDATQEKTTPFDCTPFLETLGGNAAPLMITQVPEETLTFPEHVGVLLEPNQMIRIEMHYLNYYPDPIVAHGDVDFHTDGAEDVIDLADFLFYGTTTFVVPPHQSYTSPWIYLDVPNDAKVFAITGHTHKFGTNVEARIAHGKDDEGTQLYPGASPFVWSEAPVVQLTPPVVFDPGNGFKVRCTWNNTTGSYLYFGESANKEMCFIWAYYYPTQGYRLCADGLFAALCQSDN